MQFSDISKQRIDYSTGPAGETIATLSVTLADGSTHRYSASATDKEVDDLASAFANAEIRERKRVEGHMSEEEIAGFFSFVKKAVRKVGNVVKKVANSKVFKLAAKGLVAISPVLGPLGPIAAGAGGAMMIASKLASAGVAASAGARRAAKKLVRSAKRVAKRFSRSKKGRRALLKLGNRKRKAAERLARRTSRGRRRKPSRRRRPSKRRTRRRAAPAKRRTRKPNILAAARAGRLRSNKPGSISAKKLMRADRKGRVYWVS